MTRQPMKVILDCDTGTDDAVAIMLAALSAEIELLGITTVNGNVPVGIVAENTMRVLTHVGRGDVPVFVGADHPLHRRDFPIPRDENTTFEMHGTYLDLAPSQSRPQAENAVDFIRRTVGSVKSEGHQLTIVATGPLTNIAACIEGDPTFALDVDRIVVMGGGHDVGNVTASAEFNFWADPEAAKIVIGAGFHDLIVVPLDATHQALISLADCAVLRSLTTPAAEATAMVIEQRIRAHDASQPMERAGTAPVHDALCVAFLLDSEVVGLADYHVDVETQGELTVGRSVIDVNHRGGKPANAKVAFTASPTHFLNVLTRVFASPRPI